MSKRDWRQVLAEECARTSQARVARRMGVSTSLISQVLKGKYTGDLTRVQSLVEGLYMARTVRCPVLGDIPTNECLQHQQAEFSSANFQRVMLFRSCRSGCPHSRLEVDDD